MKTNSPISGTAVVSKRTELKRTLKNLSFALTLATGTIGMTTTMSVSEARAFGLGDITGAAKKVGGTAKKVGKAAVAPHRAINEAAIAIARESVIKPIGIPLMDEIAKRTGQYDESWARQSENISRKMDKYISLDGIERAAGRAGKKVGKVVTGRNKIGGSLPRSDKTRAENALADYANRRGGLARMSGGKRILKPGVAKGGRFLDKRARVPMKGVPRKAIARRSSGQKFRTGVVQDGFFHGVNGSRSISGKQQRKVQGISEGNLKPGKRHSRREMIGRDKSVFGRPLYRKGNRKAQGIRLRNIKKSRRHNRLKVIGRDKSIYGRPVGKSRDRERLNSHKRRTQSRRSFDRKSRLKKRVQSNRARFARKALRPSNRKGERGNLNRRRSR